MVFILTGVHAAAKGITAGPEGAVDFRLLDRHVRPVAN